MVLNLNIGQLVKMFCSGGNLFPVAISRSIFFNICDIILNYYY